MKCKRKLIKIGIVCLMPLLALLLTISYTHAYYLDNTGNVLSDNLIDNNSVYSTGSIDIAKTQTGFDIVNHSSLNWSQYATFNIDYLKTGSYTLSFDQNPTTLAYIFVDDTQVFGDGQTSHNHMSINIPINRDGAVLNIRFYTNTSITNLMLNEGNEKPYSAYGQWIKSDKYQRQSLYSLFNGKTCALWSFYQDNIDTGVLVAMDTLNLDVDQVQLTLNDMPNIKNEIETQSDSGWFNTGRYYISIGLGKQQVNALIRFSEFSSTYQYIGLSGSDRGLFDKNIYGTNESQSINVNTMGNEYVAIRIFNMQGLNQNFNIQLSFSSNDYNLGYNDGYSSGYNSAVSKGNSDAYNSGYNDGFQQGLNGDLESNGFRTLLTSILSYPINLVRESLNFEFMGINISSVVMFLVSLGIVAFVIKEFKD